MTLKTTYLDLIADVLDRVASHVNLPTSVLGDIEREARAEWGGARHYIPRLGACWRSQLETRDEAIRADRARLIDGGMSLPDADAYLARRYNLTPRRIRQIISMD